MKTRLFVLGIALLMPLVGQAQLVFTAGTQVATQTQPNVNNLIDLDLASFTNNATTTLSGYTATSGQSITGSITRTNLTQGSLLTVAQMNSTIASSQASNLLSGVINFSSGNLTNPSGNAFIGTNITGNLTFTSSITLNATNILTRSFSSANSVGTGGLNSAPINGGGYLNTSTSTITLSTPVDAFGFTALQRDGSRSYTWSVRITDGVTPITVSLGGISTAGTPASMTSGDADAINYSYDTFVGYQAPTGYKIDQLTLSGGFTNLDSFSYATIPEPSSVMLLLGGIGVMFIMLRRRLRRA